MHSASTSGILETTRGIPTISFQMDSFLICYHSTLIHEAATKWRLFIAPNLTGGADSRSTGVLGSGLRLHVRVYTRCIYPYV
jgi:hypothetical protein